jgi:AraC family transcriptional regulator
MDNYIVTINKVVDYIEDNISEVITLSDIAAVSDMSKYHFHKIFKSITGETVADYIKRVRLEKSADMLIRTSNSMTLIAYESGFSSSSVFSREFKRKYSISPRDFRLMFSCFKRFNNSDNNICNEKKKYFEKALSLNKSLSSIMRISKKFNLLESFDFKIELLPEYKVLYMRYVGEYSDIDNIFSIWKNLKEFSNSYSLLTNNSSFLSIIYDNPNICQYGKCRYDVCISVPEDKNINFLKNKIGYKVISGGKYVIFNFKGTLSNIFETYSWIDASWFKKMGYEPENKPSYFRHTQNREYSEPMQFEICVPIKKI